MADLKPDLVLVGPSRPLVTSGLQRIFSVHPFLEMRDRASFWSDIAPRVRAMAVTYSSPKPHEKVDADLMQRFPHLGVVASFGVGYDHVDARWAGIHGVTVTNTPDVLNEEVADTAVGLLLCTVRELPQAVGYLRAGQWKQGPYPLTVATLRDRTVGMVGLGKIGQAIARRLEGFAIPVVYHTRHPNRDVAYKYYPRLIDMARDVDVLLVIVPGGAATRNLINAEILEALGPRGILINVGRGSVIDERALIVALRERRILSAGLDVFDREPEVPAELLEMQNVVLLPHVGTASVYTRERMEQLVVDNLLSWAAGNGPLTAVPEARGTERGLYR